MFQLARGATCLATMSLLSTAQCPHAKLHKRHNALSFHRVREVVAAKYVVFSFISGEINPADILSKHWGYSAVWHMLKTMLFAEGDTIDCPGKRDEVK